MNGPNHYGAAEACIEAAEQVEPEHRMNLLMEAQVHATLALAAATALKDESRVHSWPSHKDAWAEVLEAK